MIDWRSACDTSDFSVHGRQITVALPDGRRHRVRIDDHPDGFRLTARVATRGALGALDAPELFVWLRNRSTSVLGFHLDSHGSLVGQAIAPSPGLDAEELCFHVRLVAAECDRLEALLTGDDVE